MHTVYEKKYPVSKYLETQKQSIKFVILEKKFVVGIKESVLSVSYIHNYTLSNLYQFCVLLFEAASKYSLFLFVKAGHLKQLSLCLKKKQIILLVYQLMPIKFMFHKLTGKGKIHCKCNDNDTLYKAQGDFTGDILMTAIVVFKMTKYSALGRA